MHNAFRPSRFMLATAVMFVGAAVGCDDSAAAQREASAAPQNLQSPVLSTDDSRAVLVWEKPLTKADKVVDYHVYRGGELLGSARDNQDSFSPPSPISITFTSLWIAIAGSTRSICVALPPRV